MGPYIIILFLEVKMDFMFFFNSALLGIGLAMDAFSVSLANGLNEPKMAKSKMNLLNFLVLKRHNLM